MVRGQRWEMSSTLSAAPARALLGAARANSPVGFVVATLAIALQPSLTAMVVFALGPRPTCCMRTRRGRRAGGGRSDGLIGGDAGGVRSVVRADRRSELPVVVRRATHRAAHRRRHALPVGSERPRPFVHDARVGLSWCGDALVGGRVEGAFTSGADLGEYLVRSGR